MDFKTILEAGNIEGKRILVRVDWNVPIENGVVVDDFRIQKSLATIEYLIKSGAKVTLISHMDPDDASLKPVYEYAKNVLPTLTFIEQSDLVLLENLRMDKGEKENSRDFAVKLASGADIYVNEAFSASHREHASIVGLPKLLPAYAGVQFTEEVKNLSNAFYPKHPFLFILGGAKFDTKLPLMDKFLHIADDTFVGGALANNFFKEMGQDVGTSLVSEGEFNLKEKFEGGRIILPIDKTLNGTRIVDAGPKTIENLKNKINSAKFILWNGPLGEFEKGFKDSTLELAKLVADSNAETIVGGGDTLSAIKELGLFDKFSFVSTGGGAMLDFLATGTLPGVEALKRV
jgi:phosphoglycerate kinase